MKNEDLFNKLVSHFDDRIAQSHGVIHSDLRRDIAQLKDMLEDYIQTNNERMEKVEKRQEDDEPTLKAIKSLTFSGKLGVGFVIGLAALLMAMGSIITFIKTHTL